jgi:hypothetical protein
MILLVLSLSTEGIGGDRQQEPVPVVIPPEDHQVIEMLDLLELMELAEHMQMMNDFRVSIEDGGEGDEKTE